MGQYHYLVNLDKREYVHPHQLGDGLKLWEQAASGPGGIGSALIVLLAVSNGRGGGDFDENPIVGRWGGDRIAIVGDYAEPNDLPIESAEHIYEYLEEEYTNVSAEVADVLASELRIKYTGEGWRHREGVR